MEKQAAERLGELVLAGSIISTLGSARTIGMSVLGAQLAGTIGSPAAGAVVLGCARPGGIPALGGYAGLLYVAVGPTRVGFFRVRQGLLRPGLRELLLTVPRVAVVSWELGGGALTCPLLVELADGSLFELEVPRAYLGRAQRIAELLGHAA